jgi:hypothetical protein
MVAGGAYDIYASDRVASRPIPSIVQQSLQAPGQPLDRATRDFMEPRLGSDLSAVPVQISASPLAIASNEDPLEREADRTAERALDPRERGRGSRADLAPVRIHTGPTATAAARAVGARAFTVGNHVVFGGEYRPSSADGRRLLAHELAHVAQQSKDGTLYRKELPDKSEALALFGPATEAKEDEEDERPQEKEGTAAGEPIAAAASAGPDQPQAGEMSVAPRPAGPQPAPGVEPGEETEKAEGADKQPKTVGDLATGDLSLIDEELAEHERWGAAAEKVGAAGSEQRAGFIAAAAGGGASQSFKQGVTTGAAMSLGTKLAEKAVERYGLSVAVKLSASAAKFSPVPGLGAAIGGAMAAYDLVTHWKESREKVAAFGKGADIYEQLANSIEAISTVLEVATQIANVIAGVLGVITVIMWAVAFFTAGVVSPVAVTLTTIAGAIQIGTLALDGINSLVLRELVTVFRALHTFASEADPRDVVAEGTAIEETASKTGGFAGTAAVIGAEKGLHLAKAKLSPKVPAHPSPPAATGEGALVKAELPKAQTAEPGKPSGAPAAAEPTPAPTEPKAGPLATPEAEAVPPEAQPAAAELTPSELEVTAAPKEPPAAAPETAPALTPAAEAKPLAEAPPSTEPPVTEELPAAAPAEATAPAEAAPVTPESAAAPKPGAATGTEQPVNQPPSPEPAPVSATSAESAGAQAAAEPTKPSGASPPGGGPGGGGFDFTGAEFEKAFSEAVPDKPGLRVPVTESGAPAQVLEVGSGPKQTNLGLPPTPGLIEVTETDIAPSRPGVQPLDATKAVPPELLGKHDTILINNPRKYVPNVEELGKALKADGRIIIQGKGEVFKGQRGVNPDFQKVLAMPAPPGYRKIIDVEPGPPGTPTKPEHILGGPFFRTTGEPVNYPNARVIFEKLPGIPPAPEPAASTPAPAAEEPVGAVPTTSAAPAPPETALGAPQPAAVPSGGPQTQTAEAAPIAPEATPGTQTPAAPTPVGAAPTVITPVLPSSAAAPVPEPVVTPTAELSAAAPTAASPAEPALPTADVESPTLAAGAPPKPAPAAVETKPSGPPGMPPGKTGGGGAAEPPIGEIEQVRLEEIGEKRRMGGVRSLVEGEFQGLPEERGPALRRGERVPGRSEVSERVKSSLRANARKRFGRLMQEALADEGKHTSLTQETLQHLTPAQQDYVRRTGEMPKGFEFHHLLTIADYPEFGDLAESGLSLPKDVHRQAGHGGDTTRPVEVATYADPSAMDRPGFVNDPEERARYRAKAKDIAEGSAATPEKRGGVNKDLLISAEARLKALKALARRRPTPENLTEVQKWARAVQDLKGQLGAQSKPEPSSSAPPTTPPGATPTPASPTPATAVGPGAATATPASEMPSIDENAPAGPEPAPTETLTPKLAPEATPAAAPAPAAVAPTAAAPMTPAAASSAAPPAAPEPAPAAAQPIAVTSAERQPQTAAATRVPEPAATEAPAAEAPLPETTPQPQPSPSPPTGGASGAAPQPAAQPAPPPVPAQGGAARAPAGQVASNAPVIERVNPNYQPPPGIPDDLVGLQNQIITTLDTRATAEKYAGLMTKQEEHHKANEKPLTEMQKGTEKAISATEAHERAIAHRDEANKKKGEQEDQTRVKLDGYGPQAGKLLLLTFPLKGLSKFTGLARLLPDEPAQVLNFKRGLLKVNADSTRFLAQIERIDKTIADQKAQQAERAKQVQADAGTLRNTDDKAKQSGETFQQTKQTTEDLDQKNKQRKEEAGTERKGAERTATTLDAQAKQKQGQAVSLAAAMQFWARGHRQARLDALEQTRKRLEQMGYRVTEVRER